MAGYEEFVILRVRIGYMLVNNKSNNSSKDKKITIFTWLTD